MAIYKKTIQNGLVMIVNSSNNNIWLRSYMVRIFDGDEVIYDRNTGSDSNLGIASDLREIECRVEEAVVIYLNEKSREKVLDEDLEKIGWSIGSD